MLFPLLLGGVALLLLTWKPKPAPAPGGVSGGQAALPSSTDPNVLAKQPEPNTQAATATATVVAAAVAVGTAGAALDSALNPNSTLGSQVVAGVAFGVTAAAVAGAASGLLATLLVAVGATAALAWPVAGIILAVAALVYALTLIIQDLARLNYGQAGARNDYAKEFYDLWSDLRDAALMMNPELTEGVLEQKIKPFLRGHMARLNWSEYQRWLATRMRGGPIVVTGDVREVAGYLAPGGNFVSGKFPNGVPILSDKGGKFPGTETFVTADTLWDFIWPLDRGYIIGEAPGMRKIGPTPAWDSLNGLGAAAVIRARERIAFARAEDFKKLDWGSLSSAERSRVLARATAEGGYSQADLGIVRAGRFLPWTPALRAENTTILDRFLYVNSDAPFTGTSGIGPLEATARATYLEGLSVAQVQQALNFGVQELVATDRDTAGYYLAGWCFADFCLYKSVANAVKGDVVKLRAAAAEKKFEGDIDDSGALTYLGVRRHWTELEGG